MSNRACLFLLLFLSLNSFAGQKAITEDGQTVILDSDQTWRFENSEANSGSNIPLNTKRFNRTAAQTFKVTGVPTTLSVYIDPGKWTFSKDKDDSNRLSFRSKNSNNSDLYGSLIAEGIEIGINELSELAFENAKNFAPDAKVLKKEYRIVNGSKILYMEVEATAKSIKFKYVGYYGANKSGSVQLVVYSGTSVINSKMPEVENFLNGFFIN